MTRRDIPTSPETPDRPLTGQIHELNLMVARIFNQRVKHLGLTRSQWQTLFMLKREDGQTQTELAERLVMAKPPLGKVVDHLEQDGWVERREDGNDRRVKRVFLTLKVGPLLDPLAELVEEICVEATRSMTEGQRKTLHDLLDIAHGNLSEVLRRSADGD